MNDDGKPDPGWAKLFSWHTPWAALQDVIEEQIAEQLATWQRTLDECDLTPAQRASAEALGAAKIRERTRAVLEAAWCRLRDAHAPTSATVH